MQTQIVFSNDGWYWFGIALRGVDGMIYFGTLGPWDPGTQGPWGWGWGSGVLGGRSVIYWQASPQSALRGLKGFGCGVNFIAHRAGNQASHAP